MTDAASAKTIDDLSKISQTAWLTAYCHHDCGKDWQLDRPVSSWLIEIFGRPSFANDLSFFTRHGIAARAKWFDDKIASTLSAVRAKGEQAEVWTLGAGFDSRWEWVLRQHRATVAQYREFDLDDLLAIKSKLLSASPWAELWRAVARHPGDVLAGLPDSLPTADGPVIVVIEGLLDYFPKTQKLALFEAIRSRAPRATILLDAQSAWLLSINNKRAQRATGASDLTFAWAPPDPVVFYNDVAGFEVEDQRSLLPELIRRRLPFLRLLPMPRRIRRAYSLVAIQPREAR
jgi:O-methyltransferase involved in polyketide biosynthesis